MSTFMKEIVSTGILVLVAILLLPLLINIPDEELHPETKKILSTSIAPRTPEQGNSYFAILGFDAPEGEDIVAAGKKVHQAYFASHTGEFPQRDFSLEDVLGPSPLLQDIAKVPVCFSDKPDCLDFYAANDNKLSRLHAENEVLVNRYNSLYQYSYLQDLSKPSPWGIYINLGRTVLAGHSIAMGQIALLFNHGKYQSAIQKTIDDILLWRKFLAGASDGYYKSDALIALGRNYNLLEEMLSRVATGDAAGVLDITVFEPLSDEEKSLDIDLDRRLQELAWSLKNKRWPFGSAKESEISMLENHFVKRNATLNDVQVMFAALKDIAPKQPDEYEQSRIAFQKKIEEAQRKRFDMIYNPFGKAFVATAFDARALDYWNKGIHDLDKLINRLTLYKEG